MENMDLYTTAKGFAFIAAYDAGLFSKENEKEDLDAFEKFWELFQNELMEKRLPPRDDFWKVFNKQCGACTRSRADQRRAYLCGSIFMMLGFLVGAIITYLLHFQ